MLHEGGSIAWAQSNDRTMANQGNVRKHIYTARRAVCAYESRMRGSYGFLLSKACALVKLAAELYHFLTYNYLQCVYIMNHGSGS